MIKNASRIATSYARTIFDGQKMFFIDVIFVKIPITSFAWIHFAPCEKIQMIEPQCADGPININKISLPDGCFFKDFGWNPLGCLRASSLNISWSCKMLLKTMKTYTITTNALLFLLMSFLSKLQSLPMRGYISQPRKQKEHRTPTCWWTNKYQ